MTKNNQITNVIKIRPFCNRLVAQNTDRKTSFLKPIIWAQWTSKRECIQKLNIDSVYPSHNFVSITCMS